MMLPFQNLDHQLQILSLFALLQSCHQTHEFQVAQSFGESEAESQPHQLNQLLYLVGDGLKHNDQQELQLKLTHHLK